ncbi:MAG: DUF998 domain-containing protein [Oryzihumus sp.]
MRGAQPSRVPWWGLASAVAAPVLLVGGWTWAQAALPAPFDPVRQTISALAATGAPHRGVMTVALLLLGVAHATTALALRPAATTGRLTLAVGGVATLLVALLPLPSPSGSAASHTAAASTAFAALAVWPALASRTGPGTPLTLRRAVAGAATLVLGLLLAWLLLELRSGGPAVGLSERVAAAAQALWPLAVVLSCRWPGRRARGA